MSTSFTRTTSATFTLTHARHLSSKVAADLYLCRAYYGRPTEQQVSSYAEEFALLLKDGFIEKYEFGFKQEEKRIICWRYSVDRNGTITTDDRAGRMMSGAETTASLFYNYLWPSTDWNNLSPSEREKIEATLPFRRFACVPPGDGNGYWVNDKQYSSGGVGLDRQTFRPF